MKLPIALISLLALPLALSGCVSPGSIDPRQATKSQLVARAGDPTDIRFDRNGDELWEYATGPAGYETWLVRFSREGHVIERAQILTEERLMSLTPGQSTRPDARHVLGRPSEVTFPRVGETWSWRFKARGLQPAHLVVAFNPDGTIRDRMVVLEQPGGDDASDPQ